MFFPPSGGCSTHVATAPTGIRPIYLGNTGKQGKRGSRKTKGKRAKGNTGKEPDKVGTPRGKNERWLDREETRDGEKVKAV